MPDVKLKFVVTTALILGSMGAGYALRKLGWVKERLAEILMWLVVVLGYSVVGMLSVWTTPLRAADAWLPVLGAAHIFILTLLGIVLARRVSPDRREQGNFAVNAGIGNCGFTMGGFVCYLLWQEEGLGLTGVVTLLWTPMIVLWMYPVAQHYASGPQRQSLGALMRASVLDYRSIGLPLVVVGVLLSVCRVPRPAIIGRLHVVDILTFGVSGLAYFAIGLRLRLSSVWALRGQMAALAAVKFPVGLAVGLGMVALVNLTPWQLHGLRRDVFLIESMVPAAVTAVGIANMFDLRPRHASVLFVTNTLLYVAVVLPAVLWYFSRAAP